MWNRTLQNWQSEFLAAASMVVLAIYVPPARLSGVQTGRGTAFQYRFGGLSIRDLKQDVGVAGDAIAVSIFDLAPAGEIAADQLFASRATIVR